MDKAADAFRTISEVADELDVPKHVLRFWENRFPHIKPMKRGGGRRYYRPTDVELLRGIRHLLHNEGYTIKGVQKILREQGVDAVKSAWKDGVRSAPPPAEKPPAPRRGAKGRGRSASGELPRDRKAAIALLVRELQACRELLSTKPKAAPARARARGR